MKTKKLVSLIMAGAMTLALAVPAFATASVEFTTDNTLSYTGTVETATITVTLPPTTDNILTLNPYGKTVSGSTDQVIFPEQTLSSTTIVPLGVAAKIKAEVGSDVKLATSSVAVADAKKPVADKQLFLFLAFNDESFGDTVPTYDAKATDQQLFTAKETTKEGMITIDASNGTDATTAYYKVIGDCASQPASVWNAEKDTVKLSIAFAFVPSPITSEG